jgi:hypothetical protein
VKQLFARPLIDTTPLRLWDGPEESSPMPPEAPAQPRPMPPVNPPAPCLNCGKPSKPGRLFCTEGCKRKWSANMGSWANRLSKTDIQGQDELF